MRPFAALERFLERLFERPAARLMGAHVEPVTLARRLERAIDEGRRVGTDGMQAPTRFTVEVSPGDAAALAGFAGLEDDLAAAALEHARRGGYRIPERPSVVVLGAPTLEPGDIRITGAFADESGRATLPPDRPDRTLVHSPSPPAGPAAALRVLLPGRPPRDVLLDGRPITVGRAADVDVVVADPLVSRRHARLAPRGDRLVLTDLGSTNGTRVNGGPVREAVVGPGDRIEVGATRLEIVVVPPAGGG